jgi:hypothetical protein
MRAVIFGFNRSFITIVSLKKREANFAKQLCAFFTVVVVQILVRGFAEWALFALGDGFTVLNLDGFKWTAMLGLISFEQYSVV